MSTKHGIYDSLVFEGGALLGMAYVSALEEAERRGLIHFHSIPPPASHDDHDAPVSSESDEQRFELSSRKPIEPSVYRFAGTSIGSAFAALLACRATPAFLRSAFASWDPVAVSNDSYTQTSWRRDNRILRYFKLPFHFLRDLRRFYRLGGIWRGTALENQFAQQLEDLTGSRTLTLLDVHKKYGTDLQIVAVDINKYCVEVLSYRNKPDMPLVTAVMASMAVPGLFPWVKYADSAYVDGGVLCNYYIQAFDSRNKITGERDVENVYLGTLGFKLITKKELPEQKRQRPPVKNVVDSIPRIFTSMMDALHREHQSECDFARTVPIQVHDLDAFDFNVTDLTRALMDQYGKAAVASFADKTMPGDRDTRGSDMPITKKRVKRRRHQS